MKKLFIIIFILFLSFNCNVFAQDADYTHKTFLIDEHTNSAVFENFLSDIVSKRHDKTQIIFEKGDNIIDVDTYNKFVIWVNMTLPVEPYFDSDLKKDTQEGAYSGIRGTYVIASNVNSGIRQLLNNGEFRILKSGNKKIFAYMFYEDDRAVVAAGNLDFDNDYVVKIKIPVVNLKKDKILPINISVMPKVHGRKMIMNIDHGTVNVFIIKRLR